MFEFKKMCNEFEKLTAVERGVILAEKSVKVLAKLKLYDEPDIDPVETLATFILGSIVSDGKVDEKEYLLMYPALVKVFGEDFDFESVKAAVARDNKARKTIKNYSKELFNVLSEIDESFIEDVVALCLCVVTIDGKISLKERKYIKKLIKA